jgi:hypothetical protein
MVSGIANPSGQKKKKKPQHVRNFYYQWVPEALSLGVKRPGREADHSPPSSAEAKECVKLYLHSPIRLHGVVLS